MIRFLNNKDEESIISEIATLFTNSDSTYATKEELNVLASNISQLSSEKVD